MKCNLDTNSNISFGKILCVNGGKEFLEKNLNKSGKDELRKLIEAQKSNPVDVVFAEYTDKRLFGFTTFTEENGFWRRNDYKQRNLFETPLDFIKRLCQKADKLHKKYEGNIRVDGKNEFELNI